MIICDWSNSMWHINDPAYVFYRDTKEEADECVYNLVSNHAVIRSVKRQSI